MKKDQSGSQKKDLIDVRITELGDCCGRMLSPRLRTLSAAPKNYGVTREYQRLAGGTIPFIRRYTTS
jgi:hypothetical protein